MRTDVLDPNDPKNVISDHYPEKYGNLMMWNIEAHETEVEAVAYNIAMQIRNGGIDTVMLQEVPSHLVVDVIRGVNSYLGERKELGLADSGQKILSSNTTYQSKTDRSPAFGNLILSTKDLLDSSKVFTKDENDPQKKILLSFKDAIKKAGGEEGQVQAAIVGNQIILNVHANYSREETPEGRKKRVDLKQIYDFIQANKDKPPYLAYDIIMAGDFNAGTTNLPQHMGGKNATQQTLEQSAGYQHAHPGSSFVYNNDKVTQRPNPVDAVFHFTSSGKAKPKLEALVDANLESKLPEQLKSKPKYPKQLPPKPEVKPQPKPEETKPKFASDEKAAFATSALAKFYSTEEKKTQGYSFSVSENRNIITLPGNIGQVEILKQATGMEFKTTLPTNPNHQEKVLSTLAESVKVSGIKKVRLEVNLPEGPEKTAMLDKMWLSAVNQNLKVEGHVPQNKDIINKAPKDVQDEVNQAKDDDKRSSITPVM